MPELADVDTADDGTRHYHWSDGESYPSVTTITGSSPEKRRKMEEWAARHPNPEWYRDRQGTLGTIVHHRVLNDLSIRPLPLPSIDMGLVDDAMPTDVETCLSMWEAADIEVGRAPRVEEAIRHDEHRYAGRFDLLTDEGLVTDLKVSKGVFESYRMQAAAYTKALEHMPEYPDPSGAQIVVLHPYPEDNPSMTPTVDRMDLDQLDYWFGEFLELRRAYGGDRVKG